MTSDYTNMGGMYDEMINEAVGSNAVKGKGATTPGDLPRDASKKEQEDSGSIGSKASKEVCDPQEADKRLSPVGKVTKGKKAKKEVTAIKDSTMKKSFMDIYDEVMTEAPDIEDGSFDSDQGDFPPAEGDEGYGEDLGTEEPEGDTFAQLADLFSQAADLFSKMGSEPSVDDVDDMGMEDDMGGLGADEALAGESTIAEMKSEPEPRTLSGKEASFKHHQAPNKLGRDGVKVSAKKSAATKANDKKRTGELEDAPAGFKHDKSKMKVDGSGTAHKAGSSMLED